MAVSDLSTIQIAKMQQDLAGGLAGGQGNLGHDLDILPVHFEEVSVY